MVLDMSMNKTYFLRKNSTSLYETTTVNCSESSYVIIMCGVSLFEMDYVYTPDNAIKYKYTTLIKDNIQCVLIFKCNNNNTFFDIGI